MRFSTRKDCLVPVSPSLPHASDGGTLAQARPPTAGFASISDALQQVQDRSPWAPQSRPKVAQAACAVEPKTGVTFQPEYCHRGSSQCGELAGVGCAADALLMLCRALAASISLLQVGNNVACSFAAWLQSKTASALRSVRSKRIAGIKNINGARSIPVQLVGGRLHCCASKEEAVL